MAANITYTQILRTGTQAQYDAISTPNSNYLYWCSDTRKIYKGAIDFSEYAAVVSARPQSPVAGKIYIITNDGTTETWNGSAWTVISKTNVTSIDASSTDAQVPTAKAVYDFVEQEIAGFSTDAVSDIATGTADGTIKFSTADDKTTYQNVTVHGVVVTPSYDPVTRTITLPVSDGNDVVIALGKDIFIDPDAPNGYDPATQEIVLYLNDGSGSGDPDTEIRIPAAGLVDVYTGGTTTSATVTVGSDNTITATVRLKADSTGFTNALQLDTTDGGLYVDLGAYATTSYVDDEIDRVEGKADQNADNIAAIVTGAGTWGDFTA